jgi:hypothetical protein
MEIDSDLVQWGKEKFPTVEAFYDAMNRTDYARAYKSHGLPYWSLTYDSRGYMVSFGTSSMHAIRVNFGYAFACCGLKQMYDFSYADGINEPLLHELMDLILNDSEITNFVTGSSHRLLVAAVEKAREKYDDEDGEFELDDIPAVANPRMKYPYIYTWCQKQRKCKTASIMWNSNTCNLIHLLEVII